MRDLGSSAHAQKASVAAPDGSGQGAWAEQTRRRDGPNDTAGRICCNIKLACVTGVAVSQGEGADFVAGAEVSQGQVQLLQAHRFCKLRCIFRGWPSAFARLGTAEF